jgi:hypothetical protein
VITHRALAKLSAATLFSAREVTRTSSCAGREGRELSHDSLVEPLQKGQKKKETSISPMGNEIQFDSQVVQVSPEKEIWMLLATCTSNTYHSFILFYFFFLIPWDL